jgi:hypothetical protein
MNQNNLVGQESLDTTAFLAQAGGGAGGSEEGEDTVGIRGNGSDITAEESMENMDAGGGAGGDPELNLGDEDIDMVGSNTTPQVSSK